MCGKSSYSPASEAVCPGGSSGGMMLTLCYCVKDKRWMWGNIPGEKLIGTWERDEDYLFVYHNWARKKKEEKKTKPF